MSDFASTIKSTLTKIETTKSRKTRIRIRKRNRKRNKAKTKNQSKNEAVDSQQFTSLLPPWRRTKTQTTTSLQSEQIWNNAFKNAVQWQKDYQERCLRCRCKRIEAENKQLLQKNQHLEAKLKRLKGNFTEGKMNDESDSEIDEPKHFKEEFITFLEISARHRLELQKQKRKEQSESESDL